MSGQMGENESLVLLCFVVFFRAVSFQISSVFLLMFGIGVGAPKTHAKHTNMQTSSSITCMYEGIKNK